MANKYGLIELYTPPEGEGVKAHIIFVHGLFGNALNTWTAKASDSVKEPICWPQTLLPRVIPNTRIFSYGYDADVDVFLSSAGQNTIHQNAQNLLSDLADLRDSRSLQEIPLIFVAHSMGGIVVKDVVEADSAKIGNEREEVGSIPADHSHMTKFKGSDDIGFIRVSTQLRRWVNEAGFVKVSEPSPDGLLDSLVDAATQARIKQVRPAHQQTFHWVFDPIKVSFNDWLRSAEPGASPIYWIQGKPGSGKSTLIKYTLHDDRLLRSLPADGGTTWIVAAFFFHDRGSEIQKSLVGMFQQIVGSILKQAPGLTRFVLPLYHDLMKTQRTKKPTWDLEALEAAMLSIARQRQAPVRIFLILDALDEHHGDNDVLAALLKKLVEEAASGYTWLKVCFASRSWTVFQHHFGGSPGFAIHDYTQQDIRTYIEARLDIHNDVPQHTGDLMHRVRLTEYIANKALGVFIWVRLVMDMISKGFRDGTPYHVLEEMVSRMPQELEELYADTLRRAEPEYSAEAYRMLQVVLCGLVPLSIKDFVHIAFASSGRSYSSTQVPRGLQNAVESLLASSTDQKNWIASRSGGLLEISAGSHDGNELQASKADIGPVVQFIHQTVKDFVQKSGRSIAVNNIPNGILEADGNEFILKACSLHIPMSIRIKRDVFTYAIRSLRMNNDVRMNNKARRNTVVQIGDRSFNDIQMINHFTIIDLVQNVFFIEAKGSKPRTYSLDWFLDERDGLLFDALRALNSSEEAFWRLSVFMGGPELIDPYIIRVNTARVHVNVAGLFHSTQEFGIDDLSEFEFGNLLNNVDKWILTAVSMLIPVDRSYAITALGVSLLIGAVDSQGRSTLSAVDHAFDEERRYKIVEVLLQVGVDPNLEIQPDCPDSLDPLSICICQHSASLVRLLLKYKANPMRADGSGWSVLKLARFRGDSDIIQALLDAGITDPIDSISVEDNPAQYLVVKTGLFRPPITRALDDSRNRD